MGPGGNEGGALAYLWPGMPAQTETPFPQPEMDCEVMGMERRVKSLYFLILLSWGMGGMGRKRK